MSPTIRVVTRRGLGLALTTGLAVFGVSGCGGGGSAVSLCSVQVDRAASAEDHDPATVRYAKILEACPSFTTMDHALRQKGGAGDTAGTEQQMTLVCRQLHPAPAPCAGLPRSGGA